MTVPTRLEHVDFRITAWMARHGVTVTRLALGVVFVWFGAIKFVPGWSPAADLAARTMERLTLGVVEPSLALLLLAVWETLIGIGLITGRFLRLTLLLLFIQMPGTMLPLVFCIPVFANAGRSVYHQESCAGWCGDRGGLDRAWRNATGAPARAFEGAHHLTRACTCGGPGQPCARVEIDEAYSQDERQTR
jgi:uncharacterized membrane protein YphA (DoxX/SURF4 family)